MEFSLLSVTTTLLIGAGCFAIGYLLAGADHQRGGGGSTTGRCSRFVSWARSAIKVEAKSGAGAVALPSREDGEVVEDDHDDDDDDESGEEEEGEIDHVGGEDPEFHGKVGRSGLESPAAQGQQPPRPPPPKLSVKERKELAAYAHSLGKKLKCQQVGKSGVTPSVVAAFVETLEANELLKLKVHASCPGELPEVIQQLEESTGSVAVGRIGRSVILYRPSLSKMQKKEKQAVKKTWKPRPKEPTYGLKLQKKKPVQRVSSLRSRNSTTRT
uniref:Putative RNA-binding protein YqeI n=1 Tax=Anthurium amnicola TaxID=1678845 RepID=A0A1D1XM60_9ARAE